MRIPQLKRKIGISSHNERNQLTKYTDNMGYLHSVNLKDSPSDWDIISESNIDTDSYPYIRGHRAYSYSASVLKDELIQLPNGYAYRRGTTLTAYSHTFTVIDGMKQTAFLNEKLIVFPDKIAIDTSGNKTNLAETATVTVAVFSNNTITVSTDLTSQFRAGDGIEITGTESNNISFVIASITSTVITATTDNIFTSETHNATISRNVPDMDFIFEADNRLWGCADNTIYASALGDPYNFNVFEGVSTDSFSVAVASPGDFTCAVRQGTNKLFFKSDKMYKVVGSYPSEYTLYSYDTEGVAKRCGKSAVVVDEVLYFMSERGIMTVSGSLPSILSGQPFKDVLINSYFSACACTDGRRYFINTSNSSTIYYLDTKYGVWATLQTVEAAFSSMAIADEDSFGNKLLCAVNTLEGTPTPVAGSSFTFHLDSKCGADYSLIFAPFEDASFNKKRLHKISMLIDTDGSTGSSTLSGGLTVFCSYDGGDFQTVFSLGTPTTSTKHLQLVSIPVNRCQRYQLKIDGSGNYRIRDIQREYFVESEV